jgi:hypothetical protein
MKPKSDSKKSEEFKKFEDLTRKLVSVPKEDVKKQEKKLAKKKNA